MSSSLHSWEAPRAHRWDEELGGDYGESDSDEPPNPEEDKGVAAKEFLEVLTDLYMQSQISAQHFAVLCYWAAKAGMEGNAESFGMRPGANSGNYQRHLES
eukprot:7847825-Alexandrium_andersonii.AAC.1